LVASRVGGVARRVRRLPGGRGEWPRVARGVPVGRIIRLDAPIMA